MKKEEANDIVHLLLPQLQKVAILEKNIKVDVTTEKSGNKRGDVWISLESHNASKFENNIIALIEAKHRNTIIGDLDWHDAMVQGKAKAIKQGLSFYIVTNSLNAVRFYNAITDDEITLDGKVIIHFLPPDKLIKLAHNVIRIIPMYLIKLTYLLVLNLKLNFRILCDYWLIFIVPVD